MTIRSIAFLDVAAGFVFTGLFLWGRRNFRGNRV